MPQIIDLLAFLLHFVSYCDPYTNIIRFFFTFKRWEFHNIKPLSWIYLIIFWESSSLWAICGRGLLIMVRWVWEVEESVFEDSQELVIFRFCGSRKKILQKLFLFLSSWRQNVESMRNGAHKAQTSIRWKASNKRILKILKKDTKISFTLTQTTHSDHD